MLTRGIKGSRGLLRRRKKRLMSLNWVSGGYQGVSRGLRGVSGTVFSAFRVFRRRFKEFPGYDRVLGAFSGISRKIFRDNSKVFNEGFRAACAIRTSKHHLTTETSFNFSETL